MSLHDLFMAPEAPLRLKNGADGHKYYSLWFFFPGRLYRVDEEQIQQLRFGQGLVIFFAIVQAVAVFAWMYYMWQNAYFGLLFPLALVLFRTFYFKSILARSPRGEHRTLDMVVAESAARKSPLSNCIVTLFCCSYIMYEGLSNAPYVGNDFVLLICSLMMVAISGFGIFFCLKLLHVLTSQKK